MPQSPLAAKTDLVSLTITVDGSPIKETYEVAEVEVHRAINKIPSARIVLIDGSAAEENFEISASSDFVPGNTVTIKAGYHESDKVIFEGVVVKQGIRVRMDKTSYLVVTCNDAAVKMTVGRKNAYFLDQKDSDVLSTLIGNAGLSADVDATSVQHKELVQWYATDWDFVLIRAEVNGRIVMVEDGKVSVKKPDVSASPDLVVTYGTDLQEVDAEMDARTQLEAVSAKGWDYTSQQVTSGDSQEPSVNPQGNVSGKKLSEVVGLSSFDLQSTVPLLADDLKAWADAQLLRTRLARIRGTVSFQGNAAPMPGKTLQLDGLGARFDGNAFVSGVQHTIEHGDWVTRVTFGLSPEWFAERQRDVVAPPAAGLLPAIQGLQVGKVKQIYDDPDGETRVLVDVPMIAPSGDGIWARLASLYATNNAGTFFMPEVDDEVVLGFLNDDPRFPVILGSFYSSQRQAPYTPDEPNTIKAIVSNSQMKIWFEEVKKILTIETPGGHSITLSDENQSIVVKDSNGNKMEMEPGGITLDSVANMTLKAAGNMNIQSTGPMSLKTDASLNMQGLTVDAKADTALTAQGGAAATLKAGGNVTVQGALVTIN